MFEPINAVARQGIRVRLHQATRLRLRLRQRYRSEFLHLHQALSLRATVPIHFVYMS